MKGTLDLPRLTVQPQVLTTPRTGEGETGNNLSGITQAPRVLFGFCPSI